MAILYTPGQIMAALSLSKQQWRTFRQAIPRLTPDAGRSACFNAGDLLAAAILQAAAVRLQTPLSVFTPLTDALFDVCGAHPWPRLERAQLVLMPAEANVALLDPDQRVPICSLALVVQLAPLVTTLREHLMAAGSDPQHDLAFPPMVAGGRP
ncbi:MAG: hypothetical protein JWM33_2423 [Caulobacteraceae bacterium]|nr:hypothetical protein [Caulobacteraceae bacterium]